MEVEILSTRYSCDNHDIFIAKLRDIFNAEQTKRVIASILAQTQAIKSQ
jgi:hypothetical protein